jgi:hypothetical protein
MEAGTHELALRYLLELSTDIHVAVLLEGKGDAIAAAPDPPNGRLAEISKELAGEAREIATRAGADEVEIDATVEGGAVFLVREPARTLLCVTGPFALPGLILHDMRVVLNDLRRGTYGHSE